MGDFDAIPGDPASIRAAAATFSQLANHFHPRRAAAESARKKAGAEWKGTRARDFDRCAITLEEEITQGEHAFGSVGLALGAYATALQAAQDALSAASAKADTAKTNAERDAKAHPENASDYHKGAAATADAAAGDAADAHAAARRAAQALANALHEQTSKIVPKGTRLDATSIKRAVNTTMGGASSGGPVSQQDAWAIFARVDDGVFSRAPKPGTPAFAKWFTTLTPLQRTLALDALQTGFNTKGFNPYATIKPGKLPAWAVKFNAKYATVCTNAMPAGQGPYGYFGGGTVLGPGGVQWPIVSPYVTDKDGNVIMGETGPIPANGGLKTLDGKDPGWHTVAQYNGVSQFGNIDGQTRGAVIQLNAGGQDAKVKQVDPGAVQVDENGRPYAGAEVQRIPGPIRVGKYGSAELPQGRNLDALPDNRYETTKAAGNILLNGETALSENAKLGNHAKRRYYIDYQVNDDGRTRAVMHTYTAGQLPDDPEKVLVGSTATGFPDGNKSVNEIQYNTRHHKMPDGSSAAPDPNVIYTGYDPKHPVDSSQPIDEPVFKKKPN